MRISSASMRSASVFASVDFSSLMSGGPVSALAQAVAERDPFVEYETFAAPAALLLRRRFQIFQDAALEVVDFAEPASEQEAARLLAADAAGAEHRDLSVPG